MKTWNEIANGISHKLGACAIRVLWKRFECIEGFRFDVQKKMHAHCYPSFFLLINRQSSWVCACVCVWVSMLYTSIYIYSRSPPILRCWHFNLMQFYWFYSNGKIEYINLDTSIYVVLHMHCMPYTFQWTQRDTEWSERREEEKKTTVQITR